MDNVDIISHINDIINSSLPTEDKLNRIKEEIDDYLNELAEGDK